jgi:hypothetical protein
MTLLMFNLDAPFSIEVWPSGITWCAKPLHLRLC